MPGRHGGRGCGRRLSDGCRTQRPVLSGRAQDRRGVGTRVSLQPRRGPRGRGRREALRRASRVRIGRDRPIGRGDGPGPQGGRAPVGTTRGGARGRCRCPFVCWSAGLLRGQRAGASALARLRVRGPARWGAGRGARLRAHGRAGRAVLTRGMGEQSRNVFEDAPGAGCRRCRATGPRGRQRGGRRCMRRILKAQPATALRRGRGQGWCLSTPRARPPCDWRASGAHSTNGQATMTV